MREIIEIKISEDVKIIVPRSDWERKEWRKGFLKMYPDVDEKKVVKAFKDA